MGLTKYIHKVQFGIGFEDKNDIEGTGLWLTHRWTHIDAGSDNTRRPNLASG